MLPIRLSVIIPSFNCAAWLTRSVRSALALQGEHIEVLIIDDGSTDETPLICAGMACDDLRIRVIRQENRGISAARNVGIRESRGEYLFFLDADDELIPFDMTSLVKLDCDMIRMGVEQVNLDGTIKYLTDCWETSDGRAYLKSRLAELSTAGGSRLFIASWAYIYRRSWLVDNRLEFKEGILHEDNLFTIQAVLLSRKICALDMPAYRYIIRTGSITTSSNPRSLAHRSRSLKVIVSTALGVARSNPDVNLGWWVLDNIEAFLMLSLRTNQKRAHFQLLGMELRYFFSPRCWADGQTRRSLLWRLRRAAGIAFFVRPASNLEKNFLKWPSVFFPSRAADIRKGKGKSEVR